MDSHVRIVQTAIVLQNSTKFEHLCETYTPNIRLWNVVLSENVSTMKEEIKAAVCKEYV